MGDRHPLKNDEYHAMTVTLEVPVTFSESCIGLVPILFPHYCFSLVLTKLITPGDVLRSVRLGQCA
jgi:hypothetical protein